MSEVSIIQTLNSQSRNMQVDAQIITLDDNLFHPYFTSVDVSKDNLSPIGNVVAKTVYAQDILQYWTNYTGIVIISFNMKDLKHINTNSGQYSADLDSPQRLQNDEYNYSFIGKISKLKHKGKEIIIYLEDLGWKFLQKVPMEFRQQYIAGQPLDKAFQAICEFLGVEFAYSISDLQEYSFASDGYSVQKDGQTIETVETVLSEWKTQEEEEKEENPLDDEQYENPGLIEFDNENKNKNGYERNEKNKNNKIIESTEEEDTVDLYQEEFEKKILDLFIGNTFYESRLTDNTMNYGSITVTPTNNTDNNTNMNTNNDISEVNNDNQNQSTNEMLDPGQTKIGLQDLNIKNSQQTNTKLSKHNRKSLSADYIKTLTTSQAAELAKKTEYYDLKTIKRLRRRAMGLYW